jgi:hypothetical protein
METKQQTVYTFAEFHELAKRLRTETLRPGELERRRKLAEESDRFLREMNPISVPIEDLIRSERRYDAG